MVLLVSTYDLGRQPFGLASAAAALRAAGARVACADLTRQKFDADAVRAADTVAFFLPMHTATRLALPVIDRVRALNPDARLIAYGLYAPLNASLLRERGVDTIIGGEFEDALAQSVTSASGSDSRPDDAAPEGASRAVPRVTFRVPDRTALPPLTVYATLIDGAERRTVGYTETSRGCKHRCRHCPIVPVYDGRFRVLPADVVMADVRGQVAAGATHITFGDPDFFNGIKHALEIVTRFAAECPGITYDVTIKIEHLLAHAGALQRLRDTGCAFVTSAVEAVDDSVLAALDKGHTRADFERVVELFGETGLVLSPTFVAFTPWTSLAGYCDLLQTIDRLQLVDHVAPVQLAIRLLVTQESRLLELEDVRAVLQPFSPKSLTYPWRHADPRVDALQQRIEQLAGVNLAASRRSVFDTVWQIAHGAAGLEPPVRIDAGHSPLGRAAVPYLNEPWYCCAEPTSEQVQLL